MTDRRKLILDFLRQIVKNIPWRSPVYERTKTNKLLQSTERVKYKERG